MTIDVVTFPGWGTSEVIVTVAWAGAKGVVVAVFRMVVEVLDVEVDVFVVVVDVEFFTVLVEVLVMVILVEFLTVLVKSFVEVVDAVPTVDVRLTREVTIVVLNWTEVTVELVRLVTILVVTDVEVVCVMMTYRRVLVPLET